jgi:hypothetical protein
VCSGVSLACVVCEFRYYNLYLECEAIKTNNFQLIFSHHLMSGTIIRGTLKTPNSQLVTPISIKLQRPDGHD